MNYPSPGTTASKPNTIIRELDIVPSTPSSPTSALPEIPEKPQEHVRSRQLNLPPSSRSSEDASTRALTSQARSDPGRDYGRRLIEILRKYATFIGPGFIIAVAYIDPGNYSTDVSAGAQFEYKLLFILLLTNFFAMFLQTLSCKLGTVTGMNLAEVCRERCPFWLNVLLYIAFEAAILATDLAEVIGTAIALNILFKIPLVAGVAITMVDVLIVLAAWRPDGSMRATRYFEIGVTLLVLMVIGCFVALLARIDTINGVDVVKGYLPNATAFSKEGIYSSLSIMGAVVMPHSLILGTGLTQPRLREFDLKHGLIDKHHTISANHNNAPTTTTNTANNDVEDVRPSNESIIEVKYRPSLRAVKSILTYSIVELCLSLVTFALFVNSAILIVAGATLYGVEGAADADLFGIHSLLSSRLAPVAGTLFALALLASGQSAGIVCTMAGQLVSEGFFRWTIRPWLRRLITRSIAVLPCILVAGTVGRQGLADVLNGSQVALAILLPIIIFPLVYFTSSKQVMRIPLNQDDDDNDDREDEAAGRAFEMTQLQERHQGDSPQQESDRRYKLMPNKMYVQVIGWLVWLFITGLNVYLIAILASGKAQL
ncbi:Manganese transporter smf1 [Savitreella phatthalungensis]